DDLAPLAAVLDRAGVGLQRGARVGADRRAVVVEVDAGQLAHLLGLAVALAGGADPGAGLELARADPAAEPVLVGAGALLAATGRRERRHERQRAQRAQRPARRGRRRGARLDT